MADGARTRQSPLLFTGMVTNVAVGALGLILLLMGRSAGFRQVLPHEAHEAIKVQAKDIRIFSTRTMQERLPTSDMHRKITSRAELHILSGVKGGLAGGAAMTIPGSALWSLEISQHLVCGETCSRQGASSVWAGASNAFLSEFHLRGLLARLAIHAVTSVLVGLLYGAVLPMFPRAPDPYCRHPCALFFTGLLTPRSGSSARSSMSESIGSVCGVASSIWLSLRFSS